MNSTSRIAPLGIVTLTLGSAAWLLAAGPNTTGVTLTNEPPIVGDIIRSFEPALRRDPARSRAVIPPAPSGALELYVSPEGRNTAVGTRQQPFATLERARNEIRALRERNGLPRGGVRVNVRGGTYPVTATLQLEARDSGTESAPVIYRAAAGEQPVFSGGVRLRQFGPVKDEAVRALLPAVVRDQVVQIDLAATGLTNLGPLVLGGFSSGRGFKSHPIPQLYCDGRAQSFARSPGWLSIAAVPAEQSVTVHGVTGSKLGRLSYSDDRPSRWTTEPELWIYGYYFWSWADSYEKVAGIDAAKKEITLAPPYHGYGYRAGQPFCAINALSELDEPGEFVLHAAARRLYWLPPANPARAAVELSLTGVPLLELKQVSHVRLEGLTWELGAQDGLTISDSTNCLIAGCTVRRLSGNAVTLLGGQGNGLLSCDIHTLGRGGVVLSAGDRKTLARGESFMENCHIYELSRIDRTYTPAVVVSGAGNRIVHNWFHDIPSSAIRVGGNDHLVEFNEINRVVLESDDQGGVDMWGDPTIQGILFRHNFFHHIGNWRRPEQGPDLGRAGIRLDDAISGVMIYGNIFYRSASGKHGFGGLQIHGGKDNVIDNNIFADCRWAVTFSPWAENRWLEFIKPRRESGEIDLALYARRYPAINRMEVEANANWFRRNLVLNCGTFLHKNASGARLFENLVTTTNPGFTAPEHGDFSGSPTASGLRDIAFQPIPFAEIGLYRDAWRRDLPAREIRQLRDER